MPEFKVVKIDEIKIVDQVRTEIDQEYIKQLALSIEETGLLEPVRLLLKDGELLLRSGLCRITAFKSLGKTEVPSFIFLPEELKNLKHDMIDQNSFRKGLSVLDKLALLSTIEEETPKNTPGRKPKGIDNNEDKFGSNCDCNSDRKKFIAYRAGFDNPDHMYRAKSVVRSERVELIKCMNDESITIFRAAEIAKAPENKWRGLLRDAIKDPDTLTKEFNKSEASRRAAKRKKKSGTPLAYTPCPEFKIIRVAPDWSGVFSDILDLPVNAYAHPEIAVIAVECDTVSLPMALQCLDHWGFEYKSTITVWNPKGVHIGAFDYHHQHACYIIIGERNSSAEGTIFTLDQAVKVEPVLSRYTDPLSASLISIIDEMFPSKADKRICMTSTVKPKNWIAWKTSYGINAAASPDFGGDPVVDDIPDADDVPDVDDISDVGANNNSTSPDPESPSDPDTAIDFEPVDDEPEDIPEKRILKVFEGD